MHQDLVRKYVSWAGSIFIKFLFVFYQILYIGLHTNQGTKNYWILLVKKSNGSAIRSTYITKSMISNGQQNERLFELDLPIELF